MADRTLYFVLSNPVDGKDQEFNEWYDNVHIHDVLAMPGMVSAQRYELRETEMSRAAGMEPTHRYLCVYEIEGDVDATMAKIRDAATSGAMQMSDALDLTNVAMSFWTPRGPRLAS